MEILCIVVLLLYTLSFSFYDHNLYRLIKEYYFPSIKLPPEKKKEYRLEISTAISDYRRYMAICKLRSKLYGFSIEDELFRRELDLEKTLISGNKFDGRYEFHTVVRKIKDKFIDPAQLKIESELQKQRLDLEIAKDQEARTVFGRRLCETGVILKSSIQPPKKEHGQTLVIERKLIELDGKVWLVVFEKNAPNEIRSEGTETTLPEFAEQEVMKVKDIQFFTVSVSQFSNEELLFLKERKLSGE